jgi:HlyD family secretion protein
MTKKKILSIALFSFTGIVFIYLMVVIFGGNSFQSGNYETAVVDRGTVYQAVTATGVVEPANEAIILSPASSIIKKIQRKVGGFVLTGEVILVLDPEPIQSQIDKLTDQLSMMQNNLNKNRLNARGIQVDLDYDLQVKKLRIASLKSDLENQEELLKVGGISPAKQEKTKQELTLAEQDLKTTIEKNSIRLKQLDAEETGLTLQIDIQNKELVKNQELLRKMIVRAPSSGIILAIQGSEGEKVNTDALLVRMSNLSSLKIKGSIGIKNAELIKTGGTVYAVLEKERISSMIGTIKPVANDDKIEFDVFPDDTIHSKMIPNQKVELLIVTEQAYNTLRVKVGPALSKSRKQDVYVVDSGTAVKRRIEAGLIGNDYLQILSGLKEGDQVIICNSSIPNKKQIRLKQ